MYNLTITNTENGYSLDFNNPGSPFIITEILGLDPPDATINIDEYATLDGGIYNSSKANVREMQIAFAIDYNAAANRQKVYRVLQPGRKVRIDYTDQEGLAVYTEGYVGKPQVEHFAKKQTVTVAITCPESYWQAMDQIIADFVTITGAFTFPFYGDNTNPNIYFGTKTVEDEMVIYNDGNVPAGFIAEVLFRETSTYLVIYNQDTGQSVHLDLTRCSIVAGDIVTIDTRPNSKSVTLTRSGTTTSIFWTVDYQYMDDFPMLEPGANTILVDAEYESDMPEVNVTEQLLYEGV